MSIVLVRSALSLSLSESLYEKEGAARGGGGGGGGAKIGYSRVTTDSGSPRAKSVSVATSHVWWDPHQLVMVALAIAELVGV